MKPLNTRIRIFHLLFLTVITLLQLSCNDKNENQPDNTIFSGRWTEVVPQIGTFGRNDVEEILFESNEFKIKWKSYSDTPSDPCDQTSFTWEEHAAGTYTYDRDSVYFDGNYTDHEFKISTKCYRKGEFKKSFTYKLTRSDSTKTLILNPDAELYYRIVLQPM